MPHTLLKTLLSILLGVALLPGYASEDAYYDQIARAHHYFYNAEDYVRAAEAYDKAFALQKGRNQDYHRAAVCRARTGNIAGALSFLASAVEAGWRDWEETEDEEAFAVLHKEPEWVRLSEILKERHRTHQAGLNRALIEKLAAIREDDQKLRLQLRDLTRKYGHQSEEVRAAWAKIGEKDKKNLALIEAILAEHGYPGWSMVGNQRMTAFLVIQHAAPEIRVKYLPMLKKAAAEGEMPNRSLALVIDRMHMEKGEKQIYGSQVTRDKDGNTVVHPIEDEAGVHRRRAEMDLLPLDKYLKYLKIDYPPLIRE
ncbi:MAG: hypothetical protein QNK37_30730 [Acidobacteriota bacterium]|nr:hypothetical protein [Acidobacteriota bacterium]